MPEIAATTMNITWTVKAFDELSPRELYSILRLRNEVFVVEQHCVFQDADNKDYYCRHLMGTSPAEGLLAYTRLVPAGLSYEQASIGRVVTAASVRNTGLGKLLMQKSIELLYELWEKQPICIGAQYYLRKFYESFGFQQSSAVYLEDGIEHIEMILPIR